MKTRILFIFVSVVLATMTILTVNAQERNYSNKEMNEMNALNAYIVQLNSLFFPESKTEPILSLRMIKGRLEIPNPYYLQDSVEFSINIILDSNCIVENFEMTVGDIFIGYYPGEILWITNNKTGEEYKEIPDLCWYSLRKIVDRDYTGISPL